MEKQNGNSVIMEIRAGTGGEEAAIFAADLFRMYSKFAQEQKWKIVILDSNPTTLGGFKEIIAEITGLNCQKMLQNESGVHRVQRVPKTEKSGRVHTSTATVAILPKVSPLDIKINPADLKVEFTRSSGPGGQNVNKLETAVRLTHLPSGITVTCQSERSQLQNREKALEMLRAKLFEIQNRQQSSQISDQRRQQIGSAERAEKIRTYNFPQNRLTDHRLGKSWHDLENIMEGKLEKIIKTFEENK